LVDGGMRDLAPFIILLIVLIFRPSGIFGWERIERI
jgi:branched-subunit amino acid ABC-type transport system permease component